jgi:hypothetical protein
VCAPSTLTAPPNEGSLKEQKQDHQSPSGTAEWFSGPELDAHLASVGHLAAGLHLESHGRRHAARLEAESTLQLRHLTEAAEAVVVVDTPNLLFQDGALYGATAAETYCHLWRNLYRRRRIATVFVQELLVGHSAPVFSLLGGLSVASGRYHRAAQGTKGCSNTDGSSSRSSDGVTTSVDLDCAVVTVGREPEAGDYATIKLITQLRRKYEAAGPRTGRSMPAMVLLTRDQELGNAVTGIFGPSAQSGIVTWGSSVWNLPQAVSASLPFKAAK